MIEKFPKSHSKLCLLNSKATDIVFCEWIKNIGVPSRKFGEMRNYLANAVKYNKKFRSWIQKLVNLFQTFSRESLSRTSAFQE